MNKKNLTAEEYFFQALESHKKNNLQSAKNNYKEALKLNPNHFETNYYLGGLLAQTKKFVLAKSLFEKAIQIKPDFVEGHYNLAIILQELGEYKKAINSYEKAIKIQPNHLKTYNNLGTLLKQLNENQKAISYFEKAIQIKPDFVEAHYNVGIIFADIGEHQKAISYFEKAIQIKPDYTKPYFYLGAIFQELKDYQKAINYYEKVIAIQPNYIDAYNNLGIVFKETREFQKAISCYTKAVQIDSNNTSIINSLSDLLKNIQLDKISIINNGSIKELFLFLFRKNNVNHADLFKNAKLALFAEENNNQIKKFVNSNSLMLKNKNIKNLLKQELFLLILQKSLIVDKSLEKFITKIRNELLFILIDNKQKIVKEYFDFIASLAEQCFFNEYIFNQSKKENNQVKQLERKILNSQKINELEIAILGSYMPLHNSKNLIKKLLNYKSNNILFNDLVNIQIKQPLEEIKLVSSIKSLDKIVDNVSKKVRKQYEENPYPRWRHTYKNLTSNFLIQLNNEIKPNKVEYNNKFNSPNVLVAGCGTGQHIAIIADKYLNANIIGIDLSLTSLAYAKRKVEELNLKNVEFLHADILKLKNLKRKFDVIECVGTLHHMKDPITGLKILLDLLEPHGFLKLGLYSEIARQNIVKARNFIKRKKIKSTTEDIRNFRETINNENIDTSLKKIFQSKDFYSTSMARDLMFHVQEHRFTLPEISKMLKNLNLEFLGFSNQFVKTKFSKIFPNDKKNISLDNWNQFENSNPDTFYNMYQFWVKKIK